MSLSASTPGDPTAMAEVFATETMAELCVRQGRLAEAVTIYRRLVGGPNLDPRDGRWRERLAALEAEPRARGAGTRETALHAGASEGLRAADERTMRAIESMAAQLVELDSQRRTDTPGSASSVSSATESAAARVAVVAAPTATSPVAAALVVSAGAAVPAVPATPPAHRLPLLIHAPVRSGQIVYAEGTDLIVLAAVNPGAQLIADGNIHVYGPLRGRAIAGAKGATSARIFCQRLEAEMVGIDVAYLMADDLPRDLVGRAAQIVMEDGRCVAVAM